MRSDSSPVTTDVQTPQQVLSTWFLDVETGRMDVPQSKRWFMGGQTLDDELTRQYSATLDAARNDQLGSWMDDAQGTLALIVLTDQFNRNIHRGTAEAFALDAIALQACNHALTHAFDQTLPVTQRVFCYMPLEHDETLESQERSIALFRALDQQAPPELKDFTEGTLQYALEHQAIIEQFGRYPHRNAVLGRSSTQAELDWLEKENKRFGQ